jgi:dienelactone hydrolase
VLALAGCGGGHSAAPAAPFAYDRGAPLGFHDRGVVNHGYPIRIHDVSYASPRGGAVTGFLAVPPGQGRRPAVIYLHGSGGDRSQMLVQATWMAARGAVAFTIDSPYARKGAALEPGLAGLRRQRDLEVQTVVDLRRAVDVLRSRRDVDATRIGFVGWSAGARTGALLAGVEHRIRAFDLMSGGAAPVAAYAAQSPPALRPAVRRILGQVDPLRYVRRAAPGSLFFQNGRRDDVVPRAALVALVKAAPEPKRVRWYDAGHDVGLRAYRDQLAWLSERLGLDGPVVRGAKAGP